MNRDLEEVPHDTASRQKDENRGARTLACRVETHLDAWKRFSSEQHPCAFFRNLALAYLD